MPSQRQKPSRLCPAGSLRPFDASAQLAVEIDDVLRQIPAEGEMAAPFGLRERDDHGVVADRIGRRRAELIAPQDASWLVVDLVGAAHDVGALA